MTVVPVSPPLREAVLALAPTAEQEPWSDAAVQTLPAAEADPRCHARAESDVPVGTTSGTLMEAIYLTERSALPALLCS